MSDNSSRAQPERCAMQVVLALTKQLGGRVMADIVAGLNPGGSRALDRKPSAPSRSSVLGHRNLSGSMLSSIGDQLIHHQTHWLDCDRW